MKIFVQADVSDAAVDAFLQAVRDFDVAHPDCHFKITVNTKDRTLGEMVEMLDRIEPPFAHRLVLQKP